MNQSMSASMSQCHQMTQAEEMVALQKQALSLRLQLLEAIRGFRYCPAGVCTHCGYKLQVLEILEGFRADPHDFTTLCPKCKKRFEAKLKHSTASSQAELPFYCSVQVVHMLREQNLKTVDPVAMKNRHPAIYYSATYHHGTLRNAFKKVSISYKFDEKVDWKTKVIPFLGKLPDTVIAEVAGVTPETIGTLRKKQGIKVWNRDAALEDVYDASHD